MKLSYILLIGLAVPVHGFTISVLPINVGQGGVNGSGFSVSQVALLQQSAGQWEQLITGYQPGIVLAGVSISASAGSFDGLGNTYAEAGPTAFDFQQGLFLTTTGTMEFDIVDLGPLEAAGTLQSVMTHEIAHVLGFGNLWSLNGLYVEGSGRYTGSAGVTAYAAEFSPGASFVPVELGGGPATRDLHWNEVDGGLSNTGITDALGRNFGDEIMTGWTGPTPANRFISQTTVRSFEDLGFTVVPEPSACLLLMSTAWLVCRRRRRDLVVTRSGDLRIAEAHGKPMKYESRFPLFPMDRAIRYRPSLEICPPVSHHPAEYEMKIPDLSQESSFPAS